MIDQLIVVSVVSVLLLVVAGVIRVRKQRPLLDPKARSSDGPDTVAGWPSQATRVLTVAERSAYELLIRALPGHMVLAQLPLSRFIKVPTHLSYAQWLRRVGHHCVDLVVADPVSRVIAVIEVQSAHAPDKAWRRLERVTRVLDTVGIPIYQWTEGNLPTLSQVQALFNVNASVTARVSYPQPPAYTPTQPVSLPPVDPATVTFFIANEALPDEQNGNAVSTQIQMHPPEQPMPVPVPVSTSTPISTLKSGTASPDKPPPPWNHEFDKHLPSTPELATLEEGDDDVASAGREKTRATLLQPKAP